jgi:acyl carrier protein
VVKCSAEQQGRSYPDRQSPIANRRFQSAIRSVILDRVVSILAKTSKVPVDQITLDSTFEDLGLDSLDGVEIVYELEEEFGITISNETAMTFNSVRQIVDGLARQTGAA